MASSIRKEDALEYHRKGRPGKIEVIPTKETKTQRDLALAYSPGVAEPCLEIAKDIDNVYKYIQNQETHHKKQSFREEYLGFLEKFKIEYDEQYIFQELI